MYAAERILLIEDDTDIAEVVALNLRDQGYRVERVADGKSGLAMAERDPPDLVILDLTLPRMDGTTVCRRIRERNPYTPILMLTARSGESDRVLGLEIGADEYVVKPFSIRELAARVKALLRRVHTDREARPAQAELGRIERGELVVDLAKRTVSLRGRAVELTPKEFDLLALFSANPGRTYRRADLLSLVWGGQYEGYEHTVNSHINRLRSKIERDPDRPGLIQTVWGVGYRFAEAPGQSP